MNRILAFITLFVVPFIGKSQSGSSVFNDSYIHEIRLTFEDTTFWDTLVAHYDSVYTVNPIDFNKKQYLLASLVEIDGVVLDSVGFRIKGYSSSVLTASKRKHFKVDFGEFKDWKFDGLRKINLSNTFNDGTMVRDALIYDLFRSLGTPAPRTSYFKLYLNDEYWGLYLAVEQIDKEFLDDNFVLADGNLYKPFYRNGLNWHGPNWSMYEDTLELRTNEGTTFHIELFDLLEFINTASDAEFHTGIDDVIDLDEMMTHLALDYFVGNSDGAFIQGRNYYTYADQFNGKMKLIPWDYNFSFNVASDLIYDFSVIQFFDSIPRNVLRTRIQEIPEMRAMYFNKVCELGQLYTQAYLSPLIDEKIALIENEIILEPHSANWMPPNSVILNNQVQALKFFISNNANRIASDLSNEGYYCFLKTEEFDLENISISPNPTKGIIQLNSTLDIDKLQVINLLGEVILTKSQVVSGVNQIDCSQIESGVYFLFLEIDGRTKRLKFEKISE